MRANGSRKITHVAKHLAIELALEWLSNFDLKFPMNWKSHYLYQTWNNHRKYILLYWALEISTRESLSIYPPHFYLNSFIIKDYFFHTNTNSSEYWKSQLSTMFSSRYSDKFLYFLNILYLALIQSLPVSIFLLLSRPIMHRMFRRHHRQGRWM